MYFPLLSDLNPGLSGDWEKLVKPFAPCIVLDIQKVFYSIHWIFLSVQFIKCMIHKSRKLQTINLHIGKCIIDFTDLPDINHLFDINQNKTKIFCILIIFLGIMLNNNLSWSPWGFTNFKSQTPNFHESSNQSD